MQYPKQGRRLQTFGRSPDSWGKALQGHSRLEAHRGTPLQSSNCLAVTCRVGNQRPLLPRELRGTPMQRCIEPQTPAGFAAQVVAARHAVPRRFP